MCDPFGFCLRNNIIYIVMFARKEPTASRRAACTQRTGLADGLTDVDLMPDTPDQFLGSVARGADLRMSETPGVSNKRSLSGTAPWCMSQLTAGGVTALRFRQLFRQFRLTVSDD